MGSTIRRSNPGKGEIFRTRSDRLWGPRSILYNLYQVLPEGYTGRGVALTTIPRLEPQLNKEESYNSTPALGLHGQF